MSFFELNLTEKETEQLERTGAVNCLRDNQVLMVEFDKEKQSYFVSWFNPPVRIKKHSSQQHL